MRAPIRSNRSDAADLFVEQVERLALFVASHPDADPEYSHGEEDQMLWKFVHIVFEKSTEPCIERMCMALFELNDIDRTRWYA